LDASLLRKKILSQRDKLSPDEIQSRSEKIGENLNKLPNYRRCKLPLFFYSFRSEVNTRPMIARRLEEGKQVALPRTLVSQRRLECFKIDSLDNLTPGAYSIPEPDPKFCQQIHPSQLDIVIVPGSVFDRRGGRFGYGGGFYDRFLSKEAPQALRVALAFSFQVQDSNIPIKPHDELMDYIITEREIIHCHDQR